MYSGHCLDELNNVIDLDNAISDHISDLHVNKQNFIEVKTPTSV